MTASRSPVNVGRSLASLLAEQQTPSVAEALQYLRQLASQIARLHTQGVLYRAIAPETVLLDDAGVVTLAAISSTADSVVNQRDLTDLLPELARLDPPRIPSDIETACRRFSGAGIALDPRAVDLCQLGVLMCQLLTGESAQAYLRSPKVKGKVPASLRPILERALGCNNQVRFSDARDFLAALNGVAGEFVGIGDGAGVAESFETAPT